MCTTAGSKSGKPSVPPKPKLARSSTLQHPANSHATSPPHPPLSGDLKSRSLDRLTASPKPVKLHPPPPTKTRSRHVYTYPTMGAAMKSMFFSEPLTLKELVERCSGRLPVRVQVLVGYSSGRPHGTLSAADIYNVHFIKHQQVMSIRNSQGNRYSIPSSIQFGLLYTALSSTSNSCSNDSSSAMFPKVSDIVYITEGFA